MIAADITTVIVNWNTVDLLDECIDSVRAAVPPDLSNHIVVVDNGSADASVDHLRSHQPEVEVIANTENLGFCRANNQAIEASRSRLLLLVNTDARLTPGSVAAMLTHLDRDATTAVVGPRLVYADGSFQRWTAGRFPSLASMAVFLFGLDRFSGLARRGVYLGADVEGSFSPEWVSSAVMLARRDAFESVGSFDDRIFVYMDDVDVCARLAGAGWSVRYAADATAVHFMGSSTKRVTGRSSPEALRALNRWFVRRHGRAQGVVLRCLEAVGFGARAAVHGVAALAGRPEARDRFAAQTTHLRLALEDIDG